MSIAAKVGDSRKPNLIQISEEDLARTETPEAVIAVEENEASREEIKVKKELNFHELWGHSYWRQFTSITPGLVLLFATGTQIYWTIHELHAVDVIDSLTTEKYTFDDNLARIFCWYIGAILGGLLGAILLPRILKRTIYCSGGVLLIISSFLFIKGNIEYFIHAGRLLAGLTHGMIHLVLLVHGSDNASKRSRASILRSISYVIVFATLIAIVTNVSYTESGSLTMNRGMGIYMLGFAIFALILTPTATNESVPFLITHDKGEEALQKFVQLRSERLPTTITLNGFNEVKSTVLADEKYGGNILRDSNWRPLLLIIGGRLLSLLVINVPILLYLVMINCVGYSEFSQVLIWLQCLRVVCGFVPVLYNSALTRNRVIYKFGMLTGTVFLLLVIFSRNPNQIAFIRNMLIAASVICYSVTALGIDAIQHVQSAEAFRLFKKPWSLAVVAGIEHIVQLILIATFIFCAKLLLVLVCCSGIIILSIWLHFKMPISSGLSLSDARDLFKS